jgi:hypothetical protein
VAHLTSGKLHSTVCALGYKGNGARDSMSLFLDDIVHRVESSLSHLDLIKDLPAAYVLTVMHAHHIPDIVMYLTKELCCRVQEHFKKGVCALGQTTAHPSESSPQPTPDQLRWLDDYLLSMDSLVKCMSHRACKRLVECHGLFGNVDTLRSSRKIVHEYITMLRKGKRQEEYVRARAADVCEE